MKESADTCYMCDLPADSREHVPPRCFFPKSKDLKEGQDLRKNLDTVPSCTLHNSEKSKEDQYFLSVVTSSELLNDIGRGHYRNQIRRQNQRNPSIIARFADRSVVEDGRLGHEVEIERIDLFIDHFARALYFLHYSKKWQDDLSWFPEFISRPAQSKEEAARLELINCNDLHFRDIVFHGNNPDVFKYQILQSPDGIKVRVHFYAGCKFLIIFPNSAGDEIKT